MSDPFKPLLFEYIHEGQRWMLQVQATSEADARRRFEAAATGTYLGVSAAVIPAQFGWVAKLWVWLASWTR